MIKSITKIGNSQGIVFDAALMELARLKVGDQVNVTVHEGGAIYLTPVRPVIEPGKVSESIEAVMNDYADTMKKLA
jgi:antitoxin component of MazEF toxin-antitoxin module